MSDEIIIDKAYGFIYITTNLVNGKRYVGQCCFKENWKSYLGSGVVFKLAVKKYGKLNFERIIIDYAATQEELDEKERLYIKTYNAVESDDWYNLSSGPAPLNILRNRACAKRKKIYCYETKEIYDGSTEARDKLHLPENCTRHIRSCCEGQRFSCKNYHFFYYEDFFNMSEDDIKFIVNYDYHNKTKRAVVCLDTNEIFNSVKEADKKYGGNYKNIQAVARGRRENVGGKHYAFLDECKKDRNGKYKRIKESLPLSIKKKVYCIELDKTFNSIKEASEILLIPHTSISNACTHVDHTTHNLHFKYI